MSVRRRRHLLAGALLTTGMAATVSACRADARDFAEQAQRFIVFDAELAERTGVGFTRAVCETPPATAVGTTFTCLADASDGSEWGFTVTIGADGTYTVAVDGTVDHE